MKLQERGWRVYLGNIIGNKSDFFMGLLLYCRQNFTRLGILSMWNIYWNKDNEERNKK